MAVNVIMPQAGQDLETGIVRQWLKAEGDAVAKGEPIVQIETEKVSLEVEAPAAGVLLRILVPDETETAIFSVIGDHRPARRGRLRDRLMRIRAAADPARPERAAGPRASWRQGATGMSLIGIDLGTSAVKVGAYAVDGTPLAQAAPDRAGLPPGTGPLRGRRRSNPATAFRSALCEVAAHPAAPARSAGRDLVQLVGPRGVPGGRGRHAARALPDRPPTSAATRSPP